MKLFFFFFFCYVELIDPFLGGPDKIRPLWRHYYQNTSVIVFLIDSNDRERIYEAGRELSKMLGEDELVNCPVLIFANKQDLPMALTPFEVACCLGLRYGSGFPLFLPCQLSCATAFETPSSSR